MAKTSPTQRTLQLLRAEGWTAQVVERWNVFAGIRQDLFRCIDVIAVKPGQGVLGVQATTGSNVAARVSKIQDLDEALIWLEAPARLEVWGWSKHGPRGERKVWTVRRVVLRP